jgi:hypothetical protein
MLGADTTVGAQTIRTSGTGCFTYGIPKVVKVAPRSAPRTFTAPFQVVVE